MIFHVKDDFKPGAKVFALAHSWFNKVAAWLNYVRGDGYITVEQSDSPTLDRPPRVRLNMKAVEQRLIADGFGGKDPGPEPPSSTTNLVGTYPGDDAVATGTWTAGGANGVVVPRFTRAKWSGTYLYGYYRTETYDAKGRLCSVSGETRYVIDTPVAYSQS